jgi:hypothetical protein
MAHKTSGRCRKCNVIYRWTAKLLLRHAACPVCGKYLHATCPSLAECPVLEGLPLDMTPRTFAS